MKTAEIELGGRQFTITERPTRPNAVWRKQLANKLRPVVDLIERLPELEVPTSVDELRASQAGLSSLADVVKQLSTFLLNGLDEVMDLTISYSPELEAEAEWIGDNAYDSEILEAFTRVLGLAYPFGGMIRALRAMQTDGPQQGNTS